MKKKKNKPSSSSSRPRASIPNTPAAPSVRAADVPPSGDSFVASQSGTGTRSFVAAALLALALGCALYLGWQSAAGSSVVGCGPESGCGQVLTSRWSRLMGMPVSMLGAGMYAALLVVSLRIKRDSIIQQRIVRAGAVLVLGGALWFTIVQAFILKSFCPWCCTTHLLASAGALVLLYAFRRSADSPDVPAPGMPAFALPAAAVVGMIVLQSFSPEPERIVQNKLSHSVVEAASGRLSLYRGQISFDPLTLPCIGVPGLGATAVVIFDYTCPHCRELHRTLTQIEEQRRGLIHVVLVPGAYEADAWEIHRMMLALWKINPGAYHHVDAQLMDGSVNADRGEVLEAVQKELKGRFFELAWAQSGWVQDTKRLGEDLMASNAKEANASTLPQVMIGDRVLTGSPRSETLIELFGKEAAAGHTFPLPPAASATLTQAGPPPAQSNPPVLTPPGTPPPAPTASSPQDGTAPAIAFDSTMVDFGTVVKGDVATQNVTFHNTGKTPLTLKNVKAGCGCTTVKGWEQTVAPGQQGSFQLKLDTGRFFGLVTKTVDVESDASNGMIRLNLKVDVWCPVSLSATLISFSPLLKGAKTVEPKTLDVTVSEPEPLKIAGISCTDPYYNTALKVVEEGRRYQIILTPTGPANAQHNADVVLDLGHPKMKTLKIPVYFYPTEAVVVQPAELALSIPDLQLKASAVLNVSSNDPAVPKLEVTGLSYSGGGDVGLTFENVGTGNLGRIVLTFPAGYAPPPANDAFLTFHTNHPSFPDFKVPVRFKAAGPVISGTARH